MAVDKAIEYKKRKAFRGGGMDMGNASNQAQSASMGGGNNRSSRSTGSGTRHNPHTASGTSKTSKVSAKDIARSKREFVQNLNHNNAVRAAQTGQKFTPYKGGSRPKGGMSGLGNLLMSGIGMLMGIPGLGLLTGGFDKLKGGLGSLGDKLGDFREKTTGFRTQAEYDAARQQRQLQGRLDNMYDRKSKGKNFSQKNMDMLEAMGLQPSTAQNVLTGRDLKGFTESRGLQTPQTFSDPFANTVGTTTKVNAPASDAVSSVAPETGFFENQFNKFFSGPEFDAYNAVRTDKYANAPSKFDYDFNTNKAAMQMINDKITNNAKGTIFGGLPSELASVVGNIAAVPASIPASLGHEFVQSRERVQDQFKGASPSIMAEGPSIGDYYSGFMNENPFATAGTRALGIGAALPDALGKVGKTISDAFISPVASAEVRPAIGMESTPFGSMPTGDVGLNASGRLGNLSATVDAIDALKGESVDPQINYSGNFGNTTAYGNFSDDVQNLGLNFNNDKGLYGGVEYDAITGEPRFDIGFRRTFADGGVASMFTRRG